MTQNFVSAWKENIGFALKPFERFLSICPDEIWEKEFGGWPISQQYYHALQSGSRFFTSVTNMAVEEPCPEAGNLSQKGGAQATKEQAREFLQNLMACVEKMDTAIQEADLLKKNEKVAHVLGPETTNAVVLGVMASHMLYHLGSCDVALREHGLDPEMFQVRRPE